MCEHATVVAHGVASLPPAGIAGAMLSTPFRNVLSRQTDYQTGVTSPPPDARVRICKSCGDECEQHAQWHAHSRSSAFDRIRRYGERRAGEADQWKMPANFPGLVSPPRIQREQSHVDHLRVANPRHRHNALATNHWAITFGEFKPHTDRFNNQWDVGNFDVRN
jgi:hypothetical protein